MGLMDVRRAIINAQDQFLPPEYQRVKYLQTTGSASNIDTGVAGNDNTIKIEFVIEVLAKGNYSPIMGNHDGEQKRCWRFIQSSSTINNAFNLSLNNRRAGASTRVNVDALTSVNDIPIAVHMEYGFGTLKYQDTIYSITPVADSGYETSELNICIGKNGPKMADSTTAPSNRFHDYVKIWKQGNLVRNYIPCYRKSDNKAGFYDTVNHTFNPSIGSEEFVAGND